jgi:phosphate transport system permease protein
MTVGTVGSAPSGLSDAALERRRIIQASARGTMKRRLTTALVVRILFGLATVIVLIPLFLMVGYVVVKGGSALSVAFFTQVPTPAGIPGGGISNAIVGSLIIDGVALLIAVPLGLVVSLFLIERKGPVANVIRFAADVLSGLPSILIGLFAYAMLVNPGGSFPFGHYLSLGHFSAISASVALAVLMLPIMIRGDEEAMRTVPEDLWEAGLALGGRQSRVVRSVIVRTALPGLVTANLLGLARAVGETAPLLFTAIGSQLFSTSLGQQMNAVPMVIYFDGLTAYPNLQQTAWGAALVLLIAVLVLSIAGRIFAAHMTKRAK